LLRGEVTYPAGPPLGLSSREAADGYILLCQARASTDLLIETFEVLAPDAVEIKRLPCRIERVDKLAHDVAAVFLKLPAAEPFGFQPGQYLDIMLSGGRRRSFSIASPPHDSRLLELHVRRVPGGELTERLFGENARGTLLSIEGPLGQFGYRPAVGAPILMVGGGTGLAPLKSIMRHVLENALDRQITLYWGVRAERDLYANAELENLARRYSGFRYVPVLSEPGAQWAGRTGWVHDAVLSDFGTLAGHDVYASGPPALIAAVRREFVLRGAASERVFFDSFDYAPDTLERQRMMAANRS
jgi:CDP-4-dehydro-6-deoxyglucose reductase